MGESSTTHSEELLLHRSAGLKLPKRSNLARLSNHTKKEIAFMTNDGVLLLMLTPLLSSSDDITGAHDQMKIIKPWGIILTT